MQIRQNFELLSLTMRVLPLTVADYISVGLAAADYRAVGDYSLE